MKKIKKVGHFGWGKKTEATRSDALLGRCHVSSATGVGGGAGGGRPKGPRGNVRRRRIFLQIFALGIRDPTLDPPPPNLLASPFISLLFSK